MKFAFAIFVVLAILHTELISATEYKCKVTGTGDMTIPFGCKDGNDVQGCKKLCQEKCKYTTTRQSCVGKKCYC
uniref:Salivary protein FS48 n=1 Tax=Xenopsylla cheopis TaxID=163159 RepID=FS48_XENCH|nr:putative secreted salivary protein [Xenopsylla cheopis]